MMSNSTETRLSRHVFEWSRSSRLCVVGLTLTLFLLWGSATGIDEPVGDLSNVSIRSSKSWFGTQCMCEPEGE